MLDIGVVYYRQGNEEGELNALWHSSRYPSPRPGTGKARRRQGSGPFGGVYDITYFDADGAESARLELRIERTEDTYSLSYIEDGQLQLTGVGFETPEGLVAGYRRLED